MASRQAVKRLNIEYRSLQESSPPYIDARPTEDDILQWYYVITGPPDTPFEGGQYLGELRFPANYPYKPPSIRMLTPSGRFEPGARLCLSMSDFHPETWNPAWNISTIMTGLLSFMCSNEVASGAMQSPPSKQRELAKRSVKWNLANPTFNQVFADIVTEIKQSVPDIENATSVEVIPPKASDLVADLVKYRASAYKEAVARADNVSSATADSEIPKDDLVPDEASGTGMGLVLIAVGAGVAVLALAATALSR